MFILQFQAIPYVYVHLISLMNALYLFTFAAHKGMHFHPDGTIIFGLVFPFCSMLVVVVTCAGLLAVGELLANPLGSDVSDFAVLSFLRSCSANSRQVILEQLSWLDRHGKPEQRLNGGFPAAHGGSSCVAVGDAPLRAGATTVPATSDETERSPEVKHTSPRNVTLSLSA